MNDTKITNRDLELIYEIGSLRHVARTWVQFGGPNFANVSEHTFRVAWIALLIAQAENADVGKVLQMALMHDLTETRTGDRHYVSREYTDMKEENAVDDSLRNTVLSDQLKALWLEYEKRESLEAKIVKDADNIDCDFELRELEYQGSKLPGIFESTRKKAQEKLFTKTAKEIFTKIKSSNPHDWHTKNKNRLNSGDWSK